MGGCASCRCTTSPRFRATEEDLNRSLPLGGHGEVLRPVAIEITRGDAARPSAGRKLCGGVEASIASADEEPEVGNVKIDDSDVLVTVVVEVPDGHRRGSEPARKT